MKSLGKASLSPKLSSKLLMTISYMVADGIALQVLSGSIRVLFKPMSSKTVAQRSQLPSVLVGAARTAIIDVRPTELADEKCNNL